MVVALLAKEILDALPLPLILGGFLLAVGLEALGVPVLSTSIDWIVQTGEAVWDWLVNKITAAVGSEVTSA